ncbi:MAG TPA: hypothetical protein VLT35_01680 [Methanocella sp.]|nr:hypothetical protein [Methanocella sp.]
MKRTSSSVIASFGIAAALAVVVPALFAGVVGAQFFPAPFGYGGSGFSGIYGPYGAPNAFGGLYPAPCAMPVTAAGPGTAIASANGVTAVAGPGAAIANAGGLTVGANALLPAAFAGMANPWPACYGLSPYI